MFDEWWKKAGNPPHLVKFCDAKDNITLSGPNIRVGTLHEFRESEQAELRDNNEGEVLFSFSFPEMTPVSLHWLEKVTTSSGLILTERLAKHQEANSSTINIAGSFRALNNFANAYIFCVSWQNQTPKINPFQNYNSAWAIKQSAHTQFSTLMRSLIAKMLEEKSWYSHNMSLKVISGPVIYAGNSHTLSAEDDMPASTIDLILQNRWRVKSRQFEREREYRFLFFVTKDGQIFSVPKEPIFLDASLLRQYIESCIIE